MVIDARAGQFELNPSVYGLADAYLHLRVGILGSPAADLQEYGTYLATQNPDVVMHGLVVDLFTSNGSPAGQGLPGR